MSGAAETAHATALIIGDAGVLIRGRSGAGKSGLALALIAAAALRGDFARLVCDDRVRLRRISGRIIAEAVPAIAGLVERRGLGLEPMAHEPGARLDLVVDIVENIQRLPEVSETKTDLLGVVLPRLALAEGAAPATQCADILARLGAIRRT